MSVISLLNQDFYFNLIVTDTLSVKISNLPTPFNETQPGDI